METLAHLLIRPQRSIYDDEELGPKLFLLNDIIFERIDYEKYPCVIYCHGNCGNKTSAFECLEMLLSENIAVATFDFSGAGRSEGDYVTYGFYEKFDIKCVVDNLKTMSFISGLSNLINIKLLNRIALWGRSMGAATSLLYLAMDNYDRAVVAACLDSPFADLKRIVLEVMQNIKIPTEFIREILLNQLQKAVKKKINVDLGEVKPIDEVYKCNAPAIFVHGKSDELIDIEHSKSMVEKYGCNCMLFDVEGGHNDRRPDDVYEKVRNYIIFRY